MESSTTPSRSREVSEGSSPPPEVGACAHCGLPVRSDDPSAWFSGDATAGQDSSNLLFCCHGCMGAYALIHELGLEDFYSLRDRTSSRAEPVPSRRRSDVLQDLEASGVRVETFADGLCRVRLAVDGLHCAACSWLIEKLPPSLPGVRSARVHWSDSTVDLIYDPARTSPAIVGEKLARLGYWLVPYRVGDESEIEDPTAQRSHWLGMATAFFLAANSMWIGISLYAGETSGIDPTHATFLRWMGALLGLAAAAGPGQIFFRSAWSSLRARVPHVDVPVALGLGVGTLGSLVGAATGHGHIYFDSLASLVFLLRVGRYIQFRAQHRTGLSIAKLLRFNYTLATRIDDAGARQSVPAYRLGLGDLVEVLPGQIVPADGVVIDGNSLIQTAFITGESAPVLVQPGAEVIGGSANLQSPIRMRISAAGDESRMGRLSQMVRAATASRTPLVQRADRIGGIFVVAVVALAVATFSGWAWLRDAATATQHTVALLTIACPCALALAAPLVITIALGRAAKEGIWIRDGEALERLATPGVIWFDKTGTLTFGDLQVLHWSGDDAVLRRVSALEAQSDHPAAKAIVHYALRRLPDWNPRHYQVEHVEQVYGRGIRGRVDGVDISVGEVASPTEGHADGNLKRACREASDSLEIQVLDAGIDVGSFRMGDRERPDAIECLRSLAHSRWKLGMLSGDRDLEAQRMGQRLRAVGIPLIDCVGDLSPEEKLERVLESRRVYPTTVMVGDGINDAAALSAADVGIAIRGSGENCLRHAPIYIPDNQLLSVVRLMDASRQTVRGIHRCFAASLLYNSVTISLAVSGWIHPLVAAIFMPISGLSVLSMALLSRTFPAPSSLGGSSGPEKPMGSPETATAADSGTKGTSP